MNKTNKCFVALLIVICLFALLFLFSKCERLDVPPDETETAAPVEKLPAPCHFCFEHYSCDSRGVVITANLTNLTDKPITCILFTLSFYDSFGNAIGATTAPGFLTRTSYTEFDWQIWKDIDPAATESFQFIADTLTSTNIAKYQLIKISLIFEDNTNIEITDLSLYEKITVSGN